MGVSKQAAQKRFVPKGAGDLDPSQGFSRYTDRARKVVFASQNEAKAAGNTEIGTEHLTLGLLAEPAGIGAEAIIAQGVSLEAVREAVTPALPQASGQVPELVPFDARAKKALELTFREALLLGHNYVGTEHILLALLELEDGQGVLSSLGITKEASQQHIEQALAAIVAKLNTESTA
jgi:ATP-dependent Clp protease ATP-binding subunit ClpA